MQYTYLFKKLNFYSELVRVHRNITGLKISILLMILVDEVLNKIGIHTVNFNKDLYFLF